MTQATPVQSPSVHDESSFPSLSQKIKNEISESMSSIKSTKNSIIRRNALKAIHKNIQQVRDTINISSNTNTHKGNDDTCSHTGLLIEILQGSKDEFETGGSCSDISKTSSEEGKEPEQVQKDSISSLGFLLLEIISDQDSNELCRERSALCLKDCLCTIVSSLSSSDCGSTCFIAPDLRKEFIFSFYRRYCSLLPSKFGVDENSYTGNDISNRNTNIRRNTKRSEDAEEIRLLFIQIVHSLVLLVECFLFRMYNKKTKENSNNSTNSDTTPQSNETAYILDSKKDLIVPTGLVCQIVAKSAFGDPYPELKRESCSLVKRLAKVFPNVVIMNEELLLNAIIGIRPESIHCNLNQESHYSASSCLIRHRHAKTRSLALETVAEIIGCHCHTDKQTQPQILLNGERQDEGRHTDADEDGLKTSGSVLEERLVSHVLPRLEQSLTFDHSASVRVAFTNTIKKLYLVVLALSSSSSLVIKKTPEIALIHARFVVLLLIGMTDKVEVVKKAAVSHFNKCARIFMFCIHPKSDVSETQPQSESKESNQHNKDEYFADQYPIVSLENDTLKKGTNEFITSFMHLLGHEIISFLLQRISEKNTVESRKRYLEALSCSFEILNRFPNKTFDIASCWSEPLVINIVSLLHNVLSEDEDDDSIFQATLSCAKGLGLVETTRHLAFELVKVALLDTHNTKNSSDYENIHFNAMNDRGNVVVSPNLSLVVSSPNRCASAVNIIVGLIQGWHNTCSLNKTLDEYNQMFEETRKVSICLSSEKVFENIHASASAALGLLSACLALVHFVVDTNANFPDSSEWCDRDSIIIRQITWCCVNLLGCPDDFNTAKPTLKLLQYLSTSLSNVYSYEEIFEINFTFMIQRLVNDFETEEWKNGDRNLYVFDALIRTCGGQTIGDHFDHLVPIFERYLGGELNRNHYRKKDQSKEEEVSDFSTRIFVMALIESIVSNESFPKHSIQPFVERLLQVVIIPNLVWQVGGMASALRKVSAAVLFSILQGNCTTDLIIFKLSPRLLPVLKSSLVDDDSSLRELAVLSMGIIFDKLPGDLGEEAIQQLYPELMKCLDDSSNSVRYSVCDTLKAFLKCAPAPYYLGTTINYTVENLFIHLDDPDPCLKDKIYHVLIVALDIDANAVIKGAKSSTLSHSSSHFCDLILRCAAEKQALHKVL